MVDPSSGQKRAIGYLVNLGSGPHRLVAAKGLGTCRKPFVQLVARMEEHDCDVVVAASAKLFFVDTSPRWMERFIAVAQRHGILVADGTGAQYDLRRLGDEAAFRACGRGQYNSPPHCPAGQKDWLCALVTPPQEEPYESSRLPYARHL